MKNVAIAPQHHRAICSESVNYSLPILYNINIEKICNIFLEKKC